MRHHFHTFLATILTVVALGLATTACAKKVAVPKMYMFGFAAAFTDSIVHFTDIQEVDSVWIDSKTTFMLGRESYTFQLRNYLAEKIQMPHRTCVVIYSQKKKKIEKKFAKMLKLYTAPKKGAQRFDVRRIERADFNFNTVNMSYLLEEENGQ